MPFLPGIRCCSSWARVRRGPDEFSAGVRGAHRGGPSWATSATSPSGGTLAPRSSSGKTRAGSTNAAFQPGARLLRALWRHHHRHCPHCLSFAPFVAGVAGNEPHQIPRPTRGRCASGNGCWAFATAGYFFGNLPWVKENLDKIIWALILVPGLIAIAGAWKAGRNQPAQSPVCY